MNPEIFAEIIPLCGIGLGVFIAIIIIDSMTSDSSKKSDKKIVPREWSYFSRKHNYNEILTEANYFIEIGQAITVQRIGERVKYFQPTKLLTFKEGLGLYKIDLKLILAPHTDNLRGMFYISDEGKVPKLRLHFMERQHWYIVEFDATDFKNVREMDAFRAALSEVMPDEVRRQSLKPQPHIHYGAVEAYFAEQRITGEWKLKRYAKLYLTPLFLVLMEVNGQVFYEIPVEAINEIEALPRLDISTEGILRFRADGELFSFSVDNYEKWASQLALAASKAQEIPIEYDVLDVKKKMEGE